MDFDLPEIDEMELSNQPDQVPINNLLDGNHQTPSISNDLAWPANISTPALPSFQIQSPRLPNNHHQQIPEPEPQANEDLLNEDPPIDKNEVNQMGGLAYAEQCKERAREQCKDMRKKEHIAKGNHKFVTRQRKGDNSVNGHDTYKRRLKKNQDSAHAARHAQKIYIQVLEKLVQNGDEEKNALQMEVRRLREENSHLRRRGCTQPTRNSQVVEAKNNSSNHHLAYGCELLACSGAKGDGRYDPLQVAKLVDMLTSPEQVSAQAQDNDFAEGRMGIQPSRAV